MGNKYIQSGLEHAIAYPVGADIVRVPGAHDEPSGVTVTEEQLAALKKEGSVFQANLDANRYTILDDVPEAAKTVREQFTELNGKLADKDAEINNQAAEIADLKAKLAALENKTE